MSKSKLAFLIFLAGLTGALAGNLLLPFLAEADILNSGALFARLYRPAMVINRVEEKVVTVPRASYFSEAINKIAPSTVAVQSFSGGRLIRSGGGAILTQDGLIAAPASIVPASASVFQVSVRGQIEKAAVVSRDFSKNLALLSVNVQNLPVISFSDNLPDLAQPLLVFSKKFSLGKEIPFVQTALVSQVDESGKTIVVSTEFNQFLFGAAVISESGEILGLLDFRNQKPLLISEQDIKAKLDSYLKSIKN